MKEPVSFFPLKHQKRSTVFEKLPYVAFKHHPAKRTSLVCRKPGGLGSGQAVGWGDALERTNNSEKTRSEALVRVLDHDLAFS